MILLDESNTKLTRRNKYGDGRVFYEALGHTPDVLENKELQKIITQAVLWAAGKLE